MILGDVEGAGTIIPPLKLHPEAPHYNALLGLIQNKVVLLIIHLY